MEEESIEVDQSEMVELSFFEAVAKRLPRDETVLKALGDLYTRVGRYEDGLAVDRRLIRLCPGDAMVWYNLGCSLALLNRRPSAVRALRRAVALGYNDVDWMRQDADLRSLREENAFKTLLKKISGEAAKQSGV